MANYADHVFNLTDLVVASILANGNINTVSIRFGEGSKLTFQVKSDGDMIKAYGMASRKATIPTHIEGEIEFASFDKDAYAVVTGITAVEAGLTPNRIGTMKFLGGGAGLPYFAMVGAMAADDGGNEHVGLYKVKLDSLPEYNSEMNKYVLYNAKFTGVVKNTTTRELYVVKINETSVAVPADVTTIFA